MPRDDNIDTLMCRLFRNSGSFNLLEPSVPLEACIWIALPLLCHDVTKGYIGRGGIAPIIRNCGIKWRRMVICMPWSLYVRRNKSFFTYVEYEVDCDPGSVMTWMGQTTFSNTGSVRQFFSLITESTIPSHYFPCIVVNIYSFSMMLQCISLR